MLERINEKELLINANITVYCPLCGSRIEGNGAELSKDGDVVAGPCEACRDKHYQNCAECGASVHKNFLVESEIPSLAYGVLVGSFYRWLPDAEHPKKTFPGTAWKYLDGWNYVCIGCGVCVDCYNRTVDKLNEENKNG